MTPQPEAPRPRLRNGVHYLERDFAARVRFMVITLAKREARQAVILRIKREGKQRVSLMAASEITRLANAHLQANAATLLAAAEASGMVQRLRAEHAARSAA